MAKGGAWIVSLPGDREVTIECLPDSVVPKDLHSRGYDVRPADPPEGQRIVPAMRTEHVSIEGSTVGAIRTSHPGIVKVLRYCFQL
jgi:hypothetical protein